VEKVAQAWFPHAFGKRGYDRKSNFSPAVPESAIRLVAQCRLWYALFALRTGDCHVCRCDAFRN
jgi:hypothetical protein